MQHRLLFIAPANSIHTYRWISYFAEQGHQICLVSPVEANFAFPSTEFHLLKIDSFRKQFFDLLRNLRNIYKNFSPDIVHIHYLSYLGWLAAILRLRPLIITLWGSDLLKPLSNPIAQWLRHYSLQQAAHVTADGSDLLAKARRLGAQNATLITFGVDERIFFPLPQRAELRTSYGLRADEFVILSPRALNPLYQIEVIIEAFARLRKTGSSSIRLLILNYNSTPDYLDFINKKIVDLELQQYITILPSVAHEQLIYVYNLADVVVSIPMWDGTPVTFFEALSCGVPIMSNTQPAYHAFFKAGRDISYIDKTSPHDLAAALKDFMANPDLQKKIISEGFKTAKKHSYLGEMSKVSEIYAQISKKSKSSQK